LRFSVPPPSAPDDLPIACVSASRVLTLLCSQKMDTPSPAVWGGCDAL
jgi:hypothetical protein